MTIYSINDYLQYGRERPLIFLLTEDRFAADLEPFNLIHKLCLRIPDGCGYPDRHYGEQMGGPEPLCRYKDALANNFALLPLGTRHQMKLRSSLCLG
jgi:hypothetical protein